MLKKLCQLGLLLGFSAMLAGWGDGLDWRLGLLTPWRLQIALCFLLLSLFCFWVSQTRYGVLALLGIVINIGAILFCLPQTQSLNPNAPQIRIASINLLYSGGDIQKLKSWIEHQDADILALQEASPAWNTLFQDLKTDYPYQVIFTKDTPLGMALLSRWPLSAIETQDITVSTSPLPLIRATSETPIGSLRIYAVHPLPPISATLAALWQKALGSLEKDIQTETLPVILAGDFNAPLWSTGLYRLKTNLHLNGGTVWTGTWHSSIPAFLRIPIDHIFTTSTLIVSAPNTGTGYGSDHLPISVIVQRKI